MDRNRRTADDRHLVSMSERWFRLLQRLYPPDFRDTMGDAVVETYRDRAHEALRRGGVVRLALVWMRALQDSVRNGVGERVQPAVSWRRNGHWGRDVEMATRRLLRARGFAVLTIATLTIGLAMVTVVYTILDKILIQPMPYRDPSALYYVWRDYGPIARRQARRPRRSGCDRAARVHGGHRGRRRASADVGGHLRPTRRCRSAGNRGDAHHAESVPHAWRHADARAWLRGERVRSRTTELDRADALPLEPDRRRSFNHRPGCAAARERLHGDRGSAAHLLVRPQRSSTRAAARRRVHWLPLRPQGAEQSGRQHLGIVACPSRYDAAAVAAAVDAVGRAIDKEAFAGQGLRFHAVGLQADVVATARPALIVLAASGAVLALMLMVNLASVLLARAAQREHEFAVSRALGASDAAVMRATLVEGAVLGLIGGALGALVAVWATSALVALMPLDFPRRDAVGVDWPVGVAMSVLGLVLGLLAALVPAVWGARATLSSLLASSAVRGGGGHSRMRRGLIVSQVALSLVLLSSGALVARSVDRLLRVDPGFNPEGVLTFRVRTPPEFFPKPVDVVGFQDRVERALAAIPGATGASATSALPLSASAGQTPISFPGAPGNTGSREHDSPLVDMIGTRASYVRVMGMHLVAGRGFEPVRQDGRQEVIIDRHLAERFFPNTNPIGMKIPWPGRRLTPEFELKPADALTIVGVVEQARQYDAASGWPPSDLHPNGGLGIPAALLRGPNRRRPRGDHSRGSRGPPAGRAARRDGRRQNDARDRG